MKISKQITPVFLLTIKNSKRERLIKNKLNSLKIRYKVFYAINGHDTKNSKILNRFYDSRKCLNEIGRDMKLTEISNAEGHLRIYKYIVQKNIANAVIMEDDCYPSKILIDWLNLSKIFNKKNFDIIQLYHSFGLVCRNSQIIISKFSIFKSCSVLPYTTCYQISKKACKYILKKNKKISRLVDWPINFHEKKIFQYAALPYLVSLTYNHAETSYQKNLWQNFSILKKIKKFIPFYALFTAFYFFSHFSYFFGFCRNYIYFKEKYLWNKICYIKSIFSINYLNLEATLKNRSYYPKDLIKNAKKSGFIK